VALVSNVVWKIAPMNTITKDAQFGRVMCSRACRGTPHRRVFVGAHGPACTCAAQKKCTKVRRRWRSSD
jgi:hypothetical protein